MKRLVLIIVVMMSFIGVFGNEKILGFWKTIDDESGKAKSIVCLYEYKGKLYGRILALFDKDTGKIYDTIANPKKVSEKVKGSPKTCGLDFIWDMVADGDEYSDGEIMDPAKGSVYDCKIWYDEKEKKLFVRGKILFLGRNQKWERFEEKDLPKEVSVDKNKLIPIKPKD